VLNSIQFESIFAAGSLSLLRDGPHAGVLWGGKRGCAPRLGGARRSDGLLGAPRRRETAVYGRGCGGVGGVAKIACFAIRASRSASWSRLARRKLQFLSAPSCVGMCYRRGAFVAWQSENFWPRDGRSPDVVGRTPLNRAYISRVFVGHLRGHGGVGDANWQL
jgi:hypothetical protein